VNITELIDWQWQGYPRYHQSRRNLLLHIVAVPFLLAGNVALLIAVIKGAWVIGGSALLVIVVSLALQGRGHKLEPVPPEPFTGPGNAAKRILLEQWLTFPKFVLTGGWLRALRQSSAP
jgi:hypothetical protein